MMKTNPKPLVDLKDVRKVLDTCFDIAVAEGMLTKDQVRNAITRVTNRSCRSYGGRHGGRVYVSLNLGYSVLHKSNFHHLQAYVSYVNRAKRNTQRVANYRKMIAATEEGLYSFGEYASFANDPQIGSVHSKDPLDCVKALVAHEVAHAVNYNSHKKIWQGSNHSHMWKNVYLILRQKLMSSNSTVEVSVPKTVTETPARKTKSRGRNTGVMKQLEALCDQYGHGRSMKEMKAIAVQHDLNPNSMFNAFRKWKKLNA